MLVTFSVHKYVKHFTNHRAGLLYKKSCALNLSGFKEGLAGESEGKEDLLTKLDHISLFFCFNF